MSYVIADLAEVAHFVAGLAAFAGLVALFAAGHRIAEVAEERLAARREARSGSLAARREARALDRADTYGGRA